MLPFRAKVKPEDPTKTKPKAIRVSPVNLNRARGRAANGGGSRGNSKYLSPLPIGWGAGSDGEWGWLMARHLFQADLLADFEPESSLRFCDFAGGIISRQDAKVQGMAVCSRHGREQFQGGPAVVPEPYGLTVRPTCLANALCRPSHLLRSIVHLPWRRSTALP